MLWDIIYTLVVGLIVGGLARLIMPGRDPMGLLTTALLGIAGSFLGTLVKSFFLPGRGQAGWILSVLGALVVLWAYRMFAGRQAA
jgi:uncharacterized membrane protein YeaQ/YmgE (transglycosylase-associated protein family)